MNIKATPIKIGTNIIVFSSVADEVKGPNIHKQTSKAINIPEVINWNIAVVILYHAFVPYFLSFASTVKARTPDTMRIKA